MQGRMQASSCKFLGSGSVQPAPHIQWQCEVKRKMDEYYRLAQCLPQPYAAELAALPVRCAPYVQEIRLRVGQSMLFTVNGRVSPAAKYLPRADRLRRLTAKDLQACFQYLCRDSAFAYEEELRQGFFTIRGGCRVGVAGSWGPGGFSAVTSLNLRVARPILCELPPEVPAYLQQNRGGLLVAGPPGSGKTTFLRTLIRHLCEKDALVTVADERGELLAGESDGFAAGADVPCDVYTRFPKAQAVCMALRCMNPQYIVCDEIGTAADAAALEEGVASGATFLASVHCDTPENLSRKPQLTRLLATGAFGAAVFLASRSHPGTVQTWMDLS